MDRDSSGETAGSHAAFLIASSRESLSAFSPPIRFHLLKSRLDFTNASTKAENVRVDLSGLGVVCECCRKYSLLRPSLVQLGLFHEATLRLADVFKALVNFISIITVLQKTILDVFYNVSIDPYSDYRVP